MYFIRILILIILAGLVNNQLPAQKMVTKSFRFQADSSQAGKLQQVTQLQHAGTNAVRVYFDNQTRLGKGSYLLLKGADGAEQRLDSAALANWNYSSAYFNGNTVEISLYTAPGDQPEVQVKGMRVNETLPLFSSNYRSASGTLVAGKEPVAEQSQGFIVDNWPYAMAVGRLTDGNNANGTGWIAPNGAIVTSWENYDGLIQNGYDIIEFNVPPSDQDGNHVHPAPEDQFLLNVASTQHYHEDIYVRKYYWSTLSPHVFQYHPGYAILEVFPNSTGKTPGQKYQQYFQVARNPSSSVIDAMGQILIDMFHYSEKISFEIEDKKTLKRAPGQLLQAADYIKPQLLIPNVPHKDNFIIHNANPSSNSFGERGAVITYQNSNVAIGIHTQGASNTPSIGYGFRADNLLNDLEEFFTPDAVYVDVEGHNNSPDGSINQPYLTIPHLASDAPDHAVAYIARGNYILPVTIDRPMTLLAPVGEVRIGAGGASGARMKTSIPSEFFEEEFIAMEPEIPNAELEEVAGAYPNPFKDLTFFRFQLLQSQPVSISVYDVAGNLVMNLLNDQLEAGRHSVSWDGRMNNGNQVPEGMYILRYQQGNAVQSLKIIKK